MEYCLCSWMMNNLMRNFLEICIHDNASKREAFVQPFKENNLGPYFSSLHLLSTSPADDRLTRLMCMN